MPKTESGLTVAVTGPTGTFGHGLMPLLQSDPRIERIVGIARREFDPGEHGWTKMEYRQGDVRDPDALREAFEAADVVVHLAFMITGNASRSDIRAINVEGTLNTYRAAGEAGVKRFVYASSVAAYGFHDDNPVGMTEDHPVRPAAHLFYAQEKAEIEQLLGEESEQYPDLGLYLLRPPIVLGPHAVGAKDVLPAPLAPLAGVGRRLFQAIQRFPLPIPTLAPDVPVQFIHEDDVGQAFLKCIVAAGPPGAYNIAADGVMTGADVARELGLSPVATIPSSAVYGAASAAASIPRPGFVPPAADWVEAISHPAIMDTTKARDELGWKPKYSAAEALRATLPGAGD
jgi:nucleoside-diphosphate-sugar epimerase